MPTLVEDGRSNAGIVIPVEADEIERFAARELVRCIRGISGATVHVAHGMPDPMPPVPIFVGAVDGWSDLAVVLDAGDVPGDSEGFLVRATESALFLVGRHPAGALRAVYAFCGEILGAEFGGLGSAGDAFPASATIMVEPAELRDSPICSYRALIAFDSEDDLDPRRAGDEGCHVTEMAVDRLDWMAKHGLNAILLRAGKFDADDVARHLVPAARRRGIAIEWSHHDMGFWLPAREYGRSHPEYYAVRDAIRRDDCAPQLCLCTSNPAVADEVAANMLRFRRERPWADALGLWPNDGYGMCECDRCAALDRHDAERNRESALFPDGEPIPVTQIDRNKTSRYVRFLNEVAARVVAERPEMRIGALFYVDMLRPPADEPLHPAIDPMIALYWRCSAHAIDDPDCRTNGYFARVVDEWCAYAPGRVRLYEYYMGMDEYMSLPFPIVGTLLADWPYFVRKGIAGAAIQSAGSHHVAHGLSYAAFAALARDPAADIDALLERHFRAAYGPAADAVAAWWYALEERMAAIAAGEAGSPTHDPRRPSCYTPTRLNFPSLWDTDVMAERGLALDAAALCDDLAPAERARIEAMRTYHAYCVAAADTWARERRAREQGATAADRRRLRSGIDRLAAYVAQIGEPGIVFRRRVRARLDRIRTQWRE